MLALLQLSLPVIVILAFIVFKLNHEQKRWLFRIPVWISSTVLSLGIGHLASGVMGFYGVVAAIMDPGGCFIYKNISFFIHQQFYRKKAW